MSSVPTPKELAQPRTTDRDQLKAISGQGGMGLVHNAYDIIARRDMALKTIKGSASRIPARGARRFRRERRICTAKDERSRQFLEPMGLHNGYGRGY